MANTSTLEEYKALTFELKVEKKGQSTEPSLFYKGDSTGINLALVKLVRTIVERGILKQDQVKQIVDLALQGVRYGSK